MTDAEAKQVQEIKDIFYKQRVRFGFSQKEMADYIGVNGGLIEGVESKQRRGVNSETLFMLANRYRLKIVIYPIEDPRAKEIEQEIQSLKSVKPKEKGDLLKMIRLLYKEKQEEFAGRVGIHSTGVCKYEKGNKKLAKYQADKYIELVKELLYE